MEVQITYKEVEIVVEGTYTPPEERTDTYPGASSDFDINSVFVEDVDIYNLFSVDDLERIEELILEEIEN